MIFRFQSANVCGAISTNAQIVIAIFLVCAVYGVQWRVWRAAWRITVENLMRAFDCGSSTKYRSIPLPLVAFSPRNFAWMSCRAESKHLLVLILPCDARITVGDSSTQLGMTKKNA